MIVRKASFMCKKLIRRFMYVWKNEGNVWDITTQDKIVYELLHVLVTWGD